MFVELLKDYLGQKAGQRIDVDEPVARALLGQGLAKPIRDNPLEGVVQESVTAIMDQATRGINDALEKTLKQFAQAAGKSRRNAVPEIFGLGGNGNPRKTFGHFLLALRTGDAKALDSLGARPADWSPETKAAMATTGGAIGGYTVPSEFVPQLLSAAAEQAVVRPRATIIPMRSRSVQVPYLDITNVPTAGQTAYFGGIIAQWTEEAATLNETEPQFRQLELVNHELSGYTLASNALIQDNAIGLDALLTRMFGGAIAWFEDYAFLRGDGVGKPLGALNAPAAISVSRSGGANTFVLQDAGTMIGKLLPGWTSETTCWVVHPSVIPQLVKMVSTAAGVGWLDNLRDKLPMQLLGLPVAISEKMVALGTAKDVALVDFRHYLIGDRQDLEIGYSEHYKFINNQGTWRFVCRVDGQPWLRQAVTLADASSTVSPYLYLT
jgi:HK97 family phage major capsid protein